MKISRRDIGNLKSDGWLKNNGLTIAVILGFIFLFPFLKEFFEKITGLITSDEEEESDKQDIILNELAGEIDKSKLQVTNAEAKNIAHTLYVELGKPTAVISGIWLGDNLSVLKCFIKNKSDINTDNWYAHFTDYGNIRVAGTYQEYNAIGQLESYNIKQLIPYNKDTLKLIFAHFGTPYYSDVNGGASGGAFVSGLDYASGMYDEDWALNSWCKAQLNDFAYKCVQNIYKNTNLF